MSMLLGSSLGMTCLLSLLVKASKSNPVPANPVWANLANTLITAAMDGVPLGPAMVKILSDLCLNFLLTSVPRLLWISGRSRLTHCCWTFPNHRERYIKKLILDPDKRNGFFDLIIFQTWSELVKGYAASWEFKRITYATNGCQTRFNIFKLKILKETIAAPGTLIKHTTSELMAIGRVVKEFSKLVKTVFL